MNKVGLPVAFTLLQSSTDYFISLFLIKNKTQLPPHHDGFLRPLTCTRRRTTSRPRTCSFFPFHETHSHPSSAQLIQQSYDPLSAHRLSPDDQRRLQSELFELQRRWEAWGLVVPFLFEYADPNVQFFGAHTAQVKISRDWCATQPHPPGGVSDLFSLFHCRRESFPADHSEELTAFLLSITGRSIALRLSKVILRKLFVAVRRPVVTFSSRPSPSFLRYA